MSNPPSTNRDDMPGVPPAIRGRYVTVAGHRIFVDEVEGGDRGNILCVHTAGMSSLEWRFFLPYFGRSGYRVVAPDLPGHGKSLLHQWHPIESIHEYAELLWQLVKLLDYNKPILVGCSIGGDIVLDMGVSQPESCAAIVCCEAGIRNHTFPDDFLERGREDAGIPGFHEMNFYRAATLCGRQSSLQRVREIQWLRRRGDPKILIHDLIAWNRHDLGQSVRRITSPALVIRGGDDPGVGQEIAEQTCKAIPGAELKVLPGVGHFPMVEDEGFQEVVAEFLSRYDL